MNDGIADHPPPAVRTLSERRSAPRLPLGEITLWSHGVPYRGRGDVSAGGCFWKGTGAPQLPSEAAVSFRIPTLVEEVRLIATVLKRRSSANLDAIHFRFDQVPSGLQDALRQHADDWFEIADASGLLAL